jgi:hypothetical protein
MDEKIRNLALRYVRAEIHLGDFQRDFALLYAQARRSRQTPRLLDEVVLPLAELSRGHRSEGSFRAELANFMRPFGNQPFFDQPSAKNNNCEPQYIPIPGNSTFNAFNIAV